jgi:multiple sugar transport system permease protein
LRLVKEKTLKWIMVLPSVLFIAVMIGYPLYFLLRNTFFAWSYIRADLGQRFIGLENYRQLFADRQLLSSIGLTIYLIVGTVILQVFLGLLIALVLNRNIRGEGLIRAVFLAPWFVPPVVVGFNWMFMLASFGIVPAILRSLGFIRLSTISLLGNSSLVMPILILVHLWTGLPGAVLIISAGLKSVPSEPYEAAIVDGANYFQRFLYVTLPFIRPTIYLITFLSATFMVRAFDIILIMTGGGPGISSEVLGMYQYEVGIKQFNLGYGSTLALVLLLLSLVISVFFLRGILSASKR